MTRLSHEHGLRAELAVAFVLIAAFTVVLVSLIVNVRVRHEFAEYVSKEQKITAEEIAANLALQYSDESGEWNTDYIHGFGMYALGEGYVVKVSDAAGRVLWDAEHHDTAQCRVMMKRVANLMQSRKPALNGRFESVEFPLMSGGVRVGTAHIGMYSPYSMSENDFRFMDAFNVTILFAGILSALAAGAAGCIFARKIASPIRESVATIREIADGRCNIRLSPNVRTRELSELGRAVNRMSDALESQEEVRKRIVADVAHELRTPLANISLHLEMMEQGIWEPSRERLNNCLRETGRLTELVGELGKLSQAESGKLNLMLEDTDIADLLRAAEKSFEGKISAKNLRVSVSGDSVTARVDAEKMMQAVMNLLSNAVNYTPEGGAITMSARYDGASVAICVEDTGCGISAADLPHVFERFFRTDRSRGRVSGGAGIGLTIAKAIVEAHGGTICAESEEGRGSKFTILLPATSANNGRIK